MRLRSVTRRAYRALMLDQPLTLAAHVDLGVTSPEHYGALQNAVRQGLRAKELDNALGSGPRLTEIARQYGSEITFTTIYDILDVKDVAPRA